MDDVVEVDGVDEASGDDDGVTTVAVVGISEGGP